MRSYKVKILIANGSSVPPTSKELEDLISDYLWEKKDVDIHDMYVKVECLIE